MAEAAALGIRTGLVASGLAILLSACSASPEVSSQPSAPVSSASATPAPESAPAPSPSPSPTFDRALYSIDDAASLWVVSNKLRPLHPLGYDPPDLVTTPVATQNHAGLRAAAADALVRMFAASAAEGAGKMQLQSAYRSYDTQVAVYNRYVANEGRVLADVRSARPGHSEHQTGLAADVSSDPLECVLAACFGHTTQGTWLAANAWRFGFILRYPDGATAVTGYIYEPWHFRYVGAELSTEMHETGVATLEEFFGLPAAPDYAG